MKKRNVTIYYGLIVAIYSISYVTMSAFSSVFLLDIGLTNGQIGALLAIGSLVAVFSQPFIGTLIDKSARVSSRLVLLVLSAMIVVIGCAIMFIPNKNMTVTAILYCVAIMLLMTNQPFLNSLATEAMNSGHKLNLGVGKSLGSLGYAAASYGFGWVSVQVGPKSIPVAFSLALVVFCVIIFFYPKCKDTVQTQSESKKVSPIIFFGRYKKFVVMLLGLILVYFSHSLINAFTLQIVETKGGTSESMGTATAIAAVCELITALMFSLYMKRIKLHHIIKIAGVFFTLKILFGFIVTNMVGFYLIQGFQMFGWGFMAVGIIYYVNNMMGEDDKAQGQAYAGMSFTVGSVLATFIGGNLIDYFGVGTMLIVGTVAAAVGTLIIWITADKKEA